MLPLLLPLLIGAGAGLAKSELIDKQKAKRQRQLAAETARYSPWTGMTPQEVQEADPFGSTLQGATAGAGFGQSMQNADLNRQLTEAQMKYYNK